MNRVLQQTGSIQLMAELDAALCYPPVSSQAAEGYAFW